MQALWIPRGLIVPILPLNKLRARGINIEDMEVEMAATRSPNYPALALDAALEAVRPILKAEHRNKMSKDAVAQHLGYSSINGRALAKIGALRAYGLLEGTGDEIRVSEDALHVLEAPEGSRERAAALLRCATNPSIFKDINAEFPTNPSEQNLRFWLIKRSYTPEAATKAAQTYLATMRVVSDSGPVYTPPKSEEAPMETVRVTGSLASSPAVVQGAARSAPAAGLRQAVFPLDEGDVTLIFPADLSSGGYEELKDYLAIFLNKAQRQKRHQEAVEEFSVAEEPN